jgi:predicted kinase
VAAGQEPPSSSREAAPPWLIALRGLPGSDKSAVAAVLSRRLAWVHLDKDEIRDVLLAAGLTDADLVTYDTLSGEADARSRAGVLPGVPLLPGA